jgi:hypothetical protein
MAVAGVAPLFAQTTNPTRYLAPIKDVAMLVDVSISVSGDTTGHRDAKQIVKDILTGKGYSAANFSDRWVLDDKDIDPKMRKLFARYLGDAPSPESAEALPLTGPGRNFLSLPIGNLATVMNGEKSRTIRGGSDLEAFVDRGYPTTMKDKSTCYWYGMAQAAETLSEKSRTGYYLFVISDEEDDPDYREDGPKLHTPGDYTIYRNTLARTMPESSIRAMIGKYFVDRRIVGDNVEWYATRAGFDRVLIARFYQKNHKGSNRHVAISWYGMGVAPELIMQVPVVEPVVRRPDQPAYVPPQVVAHLQVLGGWTSDRKEPAHYERPYVVWQVANAAAAGWELSQKPEARLGSAKIGEAENSPRRIKPLQISATAPSKADLSITVDGSGTLGEGAKLGVSGVSIQVAPHTDFWLNLLAIISGVAAIGIFFIAWRQLRENRVVMSA